MLEQKLGGVREQFYERNLKIENLRYLLSIATQCSLNITSRVYHVYSKMINLQVTQLSFFVCSIFSFLSCFILKIIESYIELSKLQY